jgi:hypothetical protein
MDLERESLRAFTEALARQSREHLRPVTNGPQFSQEEETPIVKTALSLKLLAAKAIGDCLWHLGVASGLAWLENLPYPLALVNLVHPWLTLSKEEWLFYFRQDKWWPVTGPEGLQLIALVHHYVRLYPETKAAVDREFWWHFVNASTRKYMRDKNNGILVRRRGASRLYRRTDDSE